MKFVEVDEGSGNYDFYCPGCKCYHCVNTKTPNMHKAIWNFNGNVNAPTVSPSIHIWSKDEKGVKHTICHSFIKDGRIQYLGDCAHELKGQIVQIPDFE